MNPGGKWGGPWREARGDLASGMCAQGRSEGPYHVRIPPACPLRLFLQKRAFLVGLGETWIHTESQYWYRNKGGGKPCSSGGKPLMDGERYGDLHSLAAPMWLTQPLGIPRAQVGEWTSHVKWPGLWLSPGRQQLQGKGVTSGHQPCSVSTLLPTWHLEDMPDLVKVCP